MPRYAPLPAVSIDPRNEAELVQAAAQVVYEASNGTLNDFSSGNPLAVLLEGQAFAQGEFLFWANQLPDKILIEWIGPFLGAMRRLGTPAATLVKVTIPPNNRDVIIPSGSIFSTSAQLTGGRSINFVNDGDFTIPSGSTEVSIPVYSQFVGAEYNSPANSITIPPSIGITGISVTNPEPAVGGSDVETYRQVQERFFTLIRRRNPVSKSDWDDFFIDLFGEGTLTSVQPNRSTALSYNYSSDYLSPNGQIAFFVLGPNGQELTSDQIRRGQNVINFSVPIENQGHLYPITLSPVQYNLTLEVDANGIYGQDYQAASLDFRNRLSSILTPGNVFSVSSNPTVSDIDAAFYNSFDTNYRFKDPRILSSLAYNTPTLLDKSIATYTEVKKFKPSSTLLSLHDLVKVEGVLTSFYPVEEGFTPYSISKFDQTIYGNLELKQIKRLTTGLFNVGDVVTRNGDLYVICEPLSIGYESDIINGINTGKISGPKTYSAWSSGSSYQFSSGTTVDPDLIEYDYSSEEYVPSTIDGRLVWIAAKSFTLGVATNDITGAQVEFKLGAALNSGPTNLKVLESGESYLTDTWVYSPLVGGGPNAEIDPYYHYVDKFQGAISKYAYVNQPFTYSPGNLLTSEYFDKLVADGTITEVSVFDGAGGLPIYKYKPRFKCGQYLEYREFSGAPPTYCIAAKYFTPSSTNINDLIDEGVIIKLAPTSSLESQLDDLVNQGVKGRVKGLSIVDAGTNLTNGSYSNVPLSYFSPEDGQGSGCLVNLTVENGQVTFIEVARPGKSYLLGEMLKVDSSILRGFGVEFSVEITELYPFEPTLRPFDRMFTFYKGDRTLLRDGNRVQSYTATSNVTPLFDFAVYYKNGVFVESEVAGESIFESQLYLPFFHQDYAKNAEDTIVSDDEKYYYKVMRAFSPSEVASNWTQMETVNSPRIEEYAGNLLRYVVSYSCEEPILSQYGSETSGINLGATQISIIPKNSGGLSNLNRLLKFVWEASPSTSTAPELSWFPGTVNKYLPPDYREGTLKL